MKTYTSLNYTASSPGVIALGCFDGIHLGHQAVIQSAKEHALRLGLPLTVWTFEEPPKNYFFPGSVPLITDKRAKREQMRQLGVDTLVCVPFEKQICHLEAEAFFDTILVDRLNAAHIVCGFDYSFGAGGKGNVALLSKLCHNAKIGLTVLPAVTVDGQTASSSAIRQAMEAGEAERVTAVLGRPYSLRTVDKSLPDSLAFLQSIKPSPPEYWFPVMAFTPHASPCKERKNAITASPMWEFVPRSAAKHSAPKRIFSISTETCTANGSRWNFFPLSGGRFNLNP